MQSWKGILYFLAMLLLPVAGYYAAFATLGVKPGPFMGSSLVAGSVAAFVWPMLYRRARRGTPPFAQLFLVACGWTIVDGMVRAVDNGFVPFGEPAAQLGLNLVLVPIILWTYHRLDRRMLLLSRPSRVEPDQTAKVHRISPPPPSEVHAPSRTPGDVLPQGASEAPVARNLVDNRP